jgi:hypothetical protein
MFSPVSEALFIFKSLASIILISAGTFSPPTTLTISPGTRVNASEIKVLPPRITVTLFAYNSFN